MIEHRLASSAAVNDTPRRLRRRSCRNPRRPGVISSDSVGTESEVISVLVESSGTTRVCDIEVAHPPRDAAAITQLPDLPWKHFLSDLKKGDIEQVCMLVHKATVCAAAVEVDADDPASNTRTRPKGAGPKCAREARYAAQSLPAVEASGNTIAPLVRGYIDIFPDKVPAYEIDLVPGAKYCATQQRSLPRDQVEAIDAFFESRRQAGHVRESLSPHSSPTFFVKKATGGWRIVHAFYKLNDATIPAQTLIPRKDMVLDTMSGSTRYSVIDLMDGFYQILMREEDVSSTAVSTPRGMLSEWLVMPQVLKNAPATFDRMVSNLLCPYREFAPSYFDDIFIHSRVEDGMTDVEVHLDHLRHVFEVMRENKLYANLKKCIICAPEIPVLGSYVSKEGVRADPEKIEAVCAWPLRQWLGLATYLHHYSKNFALTIQPLSHLLKAGATWSWCPEHQTAFDAV
ncbi:polyprotein [Phytophthora megakarya]|uniref:Polyprotein n=1 Tax=Phytophthora megakarya TaxID=4795 RepID=A0A225W8L2_9STRA|nr:polyprotein [Phytophthora megakarya]